MPVSYIPTEEFPPNELFGDFNLFDHCANDETPKHKYQFRIAENRSDITDMIESFLKTPKADEPLAKYNLSVVSEFCYQAFLKAYSYDLRTDFLDYQLARAPAKGLFLKRVQNLLSTHNWDCDGIDFGDSDFKKKAVANWLDIKANNLKKGIIKKDLSHRHHALIYFFKCEAGCLPKEFNRTKIRGQFGKAREKAIDTIWNKGKSTYYPPTIEELEKIMPHLRIYSNAFKFAQNELDKLIHYM